MFWVLRFLVSYGGVVILLCGSGLLLDHVGMCFGLLDGIVSFVVCLFVCGACSASGLLLNFWLYGVGGGLVAG